MDEMFAALSGPDAQSNEGPIPGQIPTKGKKPQSPDYSRVQVRYYVANMSDPSDRLMAETIMTRSLRSMNQMREPGDIVVFREDQHFDKEGNYFVALKYAEMMKEDEDTNEV